MGIKRLKKEETMASVIVILVLYRHMNNSRAFWMTATEQTSEGLGFADESHH